MRNHFLFPLFLALMTSGIAAAQDLSIAAAHVKLNRTEIVWKVQADASSIYEVLMEREALTLEGAQASTKHAQMHHKAFQSYEILEAYTLKADGRRIPVDKDGVQIQSGIASGSAAASWPEAVITQLTFPDVQKGDRTVWRSRLTTHKTELEGWARLQEYLVPAIAVDHFRARIEAPRVLNMKLSAKRLKLVEKPAMGDLQIWEAEGRVVAMPIDSYPLNLLRDSPQLLASTIPDAAQLAAAYDTVSSPKIQVTAEVRHLTEQITAGKTTARDKSAAIHDWIRSNVRYVAVYLGAGGWVPHDIDWILKNRYGDCKDHVLLMQTMLKAAGIDAAPVLINTLAEYELPDLPVEFNHAIVYLPELDLFVDPTDPSTPFGRLPLQDADKPVAVALSSGATVMRTPAFSSDTNSIRVKTVLTVDKEGKVTGGVEALSQGHAAGVLQNRLLAISDETRPVAVQKILEAGQLQGSGVIEFAPVQRHTQQQTLKISALKIDNLIADPLGGSMTPQPMLALPIYISHVMHNYSPASRTSTMYCLPYHVREDFEMQFDPIYQIDRVPSALKETHVDGIAFESHYERDGNTVRGWREIKVSHARHSCSPAQFASRRGVMNRISQNIRGGVIFQQKP